MIKFAALALVVLAGIVAAGACAALVLQVGDREVDVGVAAAATVAAIIVLGMMVEGD